jgi:hypothetical protein
MSEPTTETKAKPAKQFRCGAVGVSVWARRANDGSTFYSATPSRCYKDKAENWVYVDSLNRDDLPICATLLNMAFAWITTQEAKAKEQAVG